MVPNLPGSFRALRNCLLIQIRYSVFSECAASPYCSCGSFVVIFGVLFGNLHMAFWRPIIFLSNLVMVSMEYGTV